MEFEVKDMTCGHCAGVVTKAIKDVDANAAVEIDLETHVVRVESTHGASDVAAAIERAGYSPTVRA